MAETAVKPETDLQAEPSEGWGARRVPRETNIDALTPANIKTLLIDAEAGHIEAQSELFELMEERDGELAAHLRTRRAGVLRSPWSIDPDPEAESASAADRAVDYCRQVIADIPDMEETLADLLDAIGKGFAIQEIEWATSRTAWTPTEMIYRPQRWFRLAGDGRTLRLLGDTAGETLPINPLNFVVHRVRSQSGFDWRTGLMRSCVRAFIVRFFAWKDWMAFGEIYGMPPRVGYLREDVAWDSQEAQNLYSAVQALGTDCAVLIQEGNRIEFPGGQRAAGEGQVYQAMLDRAGRELTLAILGQLLTSGGEGGGSYALGEVHNQVRWDLIVSDTRSLERTLREQLLARIVAFNLGPDAPVPMWSFRVEKPTDLSELATGVKTLVEAGMPIPVRWVRERFGIPEAEAGDAILVPPAVARLGGMADAANEQVLNAPLTPRQSGVEVRNQDEGDPVADDRAEGTVPELGMDWLRQKRVVDAGVWGTLSPAGRQLAWYVEGLSTSRIALVAGELMQSFESGETQNDFLARLEAAGISVPGSQVPEDGQISAAHARLVARQNRYTAYGAESYLRAQETREDRPWGQYETIGDEATRPTHAALHGIVKPLGDVFWDSYWAPWELGCRCRVNTISESEMEREGLAPADDAELAARYQVAQVLAGQIYGEDEFRAAVRGMSGELRQRRDAGEDLASLAPPSNPQFTFARGDAYFLASRGEEPATEAGRAEWARLLDVGMGVEILS